MIKHNHCKYPVEQGAVFTKQWCRYDYDEEDDEEEEDAAAVADIYIYCVEIQNSSILLHDQ